MAARIIADEEISIYKLMRHLTKHLTLEQLAWEIQTITNDELYELLKYYQFCMLDNKNYGGKEDYEAVHKMIIAETLLRVEV